MLRSPGSTRVALQLTEMCCASVVGSKVELGTRAKINRNRNRCPALARHTAEKAQHQQHTVFLDAQQLDIASLYAAPPLPTQP